MAVASNPATLASPARCESKEGNPAPLQSNPAMGLETRRRVAEQWRRGFQPGTGLMDGKCPGAGLQGGGAGFLSQLGAGLLGGVVTDALLSLFCLLGSQSGGSHVLQ